MGEKRNAYRDLMVKPEEKVHLLDLQCSCSLHATKNACSLQPVRKKA
jgi:hypothetical protein